MRSLFSEGSFNNHKGEVWYAPREDSTLPAFEVNFVFKLGHLEGF